MTQQRMTIIPDLYSDPFEERGKKRLRQRLEVLGCRVEIESNSPELLRLASVAYDGLPRHRLAPVMPQLRIGLLLKEAAAHRRSEPPALAMTSGVGLLGATAGGSSFVALSPAERTALVVVTPAMLRFPYHTRYELIEFALFTLATRVQGLVPLHAACIGRNGSGVLLIGASGSGKSTVSLLCLLAGFEFLSEDSVFVMPDSLRATAVTNFVHVRADSLRWVARERDAAAIRRSPVITRRSGVKKFEVDLRKRRYKLASQPQTIRSVVFLSATVGRPVLQPLSRSAMLARLTASQPYAAGQPGWSTFCASLARLDSFELRRGQHAAEAVEALEQIMQRMIR